VTLRRRDALWLGALLVLAGCRPKTAGSPAGADEGKTDGGRTRLTVTEGDGAKPPPAKKGPVARPGHALSKPEAEKYALALINRDRAAAGLSAVSWDPVAAAAGNRHAHDMAKGGFTAHWGTDGSVPELRYTEAGGEDLSQENAACFGDAKSREPDDDGPFEPAEIERFHDAFMAEVPPNDGHRKNILTAQHNKVGVGLVGAKGSKIVCMSQEFVDDYGSYSSIPKKAKAGDVLSVKGEVSAPATFGGVGISRAPAAKPRSPEDLLKTGGYEMPSPFVAYFPKGFKTPKPVEVNGNKFSIDIPLSDLPGSGIYSVQVFARMPNGGKSLIPISMRTFIVP
jgi:uncharacterized protein YkwD